MQQIKAPIEEEAKFTSVFLAGGITNCPDWQSQVTAALDALPVTIFNPRRDVFPDDPKGSEEQIRWEFERLRRANVISFWFPKETLNPITLFEFGAAMERSAPLVVGVDPEYKRKADVEIQMKLRRPEIKAVYSLAELIEGITSLLGQAQKL
jgi:hypothetical protein